MNGKHLMIFTMVLIYGSHLGASTLTIPAATYLTDAEYKTYGGNVINQDNSGTTPGTSSEPGATASLAAAGAIPIVLFATASDAGPNSSTIAGANLDYYFAVSGPSGGPVPVFIDFTLSASISGVGSGHAFIYLDPNANHAFFEQAFVGCNSNGGSCTSISGSFQPRLETDVINEILMNVGASGGNDPNSGTGAGTGYADPHIYVDPTFPGAANYSILLSPGIGNGLPDQSAAPEPASFVLVGIAFCTAALLRRRKAVGPKTIRVN